MTGLKQDIHWNVLDTTHPIDSLKSQTPLSRYFTDAHRGYRQDGFYQLLDDSDRSTSDECMWFYFISARKLLKESKTHTDVLVLGDAVTVTEYTCRLVIGAMYNPRITERKYTWEEYADKADILFLGTTDTLKAAKQLALTHRNEQTIHDVFFQGLLHVNRIDHRIYKMDTSSRDSER